jgi:beta-phosphoglucomutase
MNKELRAAIFDLDGVIVDTARYHYLAWKRLAKQLGFDFTETHNERLKGVSRMRSLDILLEIGGSDPDEPTRVALAAQKNAWYVQYVSQMDTDEILPGALEYLRRIKKRGVRTALASASKNAPLILDRLRLMAFFDAVVDGTMVRRAKPHPEVFTKAAERLGVAPKHCVVFEDAEAGIEAAKRAGMTAIGVGSPVVLRAADVVIGGFPELLSAKGTTSRVTALVAAH